MMRTEWRSAIAGLIWSSLVLLLGVGCEVFDPPSPPLVRLQIAQQALDNARTEGALVYAEELYRQSEDLIASGWREMGRQQGRLGLLRDFSAAESLLIRAEELARKAAEKSRDSVNTLRTMARQNADSLRREISLWREQLSAQLLHYDADAWWRRAQTYLLTAEYLIRDGFYSEAMRQLTLGEKALGRVGELIAARINADNGYIPIWRKWANNLIEKTRASGGYGILVHKSERKLHLYRNGHLVFSFPCDLGFNPGVQKMFQSDGATPEGEYVIDRIVNPSRYYKALHINYPNDADKVRFQEAKRKGIIARNAHIGGLIEIHGYGGQNKDWTRGCIAVENHQMDTLFKYVQVGTPVTIVRKL
ncbi:MAG: murein L,D-transpeptidase family protein [bacterium]